MTLPLPGVPDPARTGGLQAVAAGARGVYLGCGTIRM